MQKNTVYTCTRCKSKEPWLYGVLNRKGGVCYECYLALTKDIPTHPDQLDFFKGES